MDLTTRCKDLQKNNLCIYYAPEGSEGRDMIVFVKDVIIGALQKPLEAEW